MGRTPWSARVPPDPFFGDKVCKPARGPAADQGVRPTIMRKTVFWKLKRREILLGERTAVMGVLNVTPDSFSDGGRYSDPDRAFARAIEIEEQGADIIDIGAESTRPGAARIPPTKSGIALAPC